MQTCSICLEDDEKLINPKHCSCKIYLHEKCLHLIETKGMLCPICRIKNLSIGHVYHHNIPHIFNNDGTLFDRIIHTPLALFQRYQNVFTFLFYLISSFIISFLFLLPMFIFEYIKEKRIGFVVFFIGAMLILFCFVSVRTTMEYY